jgi:hypothetical protein
VRRPTTAGGKERCRGNQSTQKTLPSNHQDEGNSFRRRESGRAPFFIPSTTSSVADVTNKREFPKNKGRVTTRRHEMARWGAEGFSDGEMPARQGPGGGLGWSGVDRAW